MEQSDFNYTTYIRCSPEKLWQALTDPAFTQRYFFGVRFESDWKPGSPLYSRDPGGAQSAWGTVLRVEKPRLLEYTFEGEAHGMAGRATVATFEMQAHGNGTRLVLTHSRLTDVDPRRNTFSGLNNGWPAILSSLKSLVETGQPLVLAAMDAHGDYA